MPVAKPTVSSSRRKRLRCDTPGRNARMCKRIRIARQTEPSKYLSLSTGGLRAITHLTLPHDDNLGCYAKAVWGIL